MGRFVIWTQAAFESLDSVYEAKSNYRLPSNIVSNTDYKSLINSTEIQAVVRPAGEANTKRPHVLKKNPLKNKQVMLRLNPYAKTFSAEKLGSIKVESKKTKPSKGQFVNVLKQ